MFFKALLNTLILALVLAAHPAFALVKTPLTRQHNAPNIVNHDQTRACHFATGCVINEPITNSAVQYTANVGVGTPPTTCTL